MECVCSAYRCAQLLYTTQHRTVLIIFPSYPPENHHSSDDIYREDGEKQYAYMLIADNQLIHKLCLSVGWLEFNVPFQHIYDYIRDKNYDFLSNINVRRKNVSDNVYVSFSCTLKFKFLYFILILSSSSYNLQSLFRSHPVQCTQPNRVHQNNLATAVIM